MDLGLKDKRALVLGSTRGIGQGIAGVLAQEGASVAVCGRNVDDAHTVAEEISGNTGATTRSYGVDLMDKASVAALIDTSDKDFNGFDIVINNAGVATGDRIEDGDWAWWDWIIDINLKGVALGCRTFTPMMKQQGHGAFVNVASLAGLLKAPSMSSYNATKAAVVALSETMHFELMPYGIGVTALCPGFFRTNLNHGMKTSDPDMLKFVDKVFEASALDADDIAEAAYKAVLKNEKICNPHPAGRRAYFFKKYVPFLFNKGMLKMAEGLKKREQQRKSFATGDSQSVMGNGKA